MGARGSFAPCPIKALARPSRALWEEGPAGSMKYDNDKSCTTVMFRGAREKRTFLLLKYREVSQDDTIENPLWKLIIRRSLEFHDAA